MKCWVAPLLTVSPAHRLFMWLCEEQPLPLSAAHPHPSIFHSARARLGGKSDLFCRGEFLGELVKASTVWAFISVERRRGRKERWRWRRLTEESLDTASLVRQQPQRVIERGKERKQKSTLMMKQVERQKKSASWITSSVLFSSLHSSLSAPSIWLHALQVNNKLLPSPSPFLTRFSPSTITLYAFH